jgi:glycerol-3-phosphate O-acyltransferase/dihydroxyacetone phosphate acyltransferase
MYIEALAGSSVKIAARDVLATWKILVALVGMPTLYGFYSFLLFLYLSYQGYNHAFSLSLLVWVILPFIQYICVLVLENSIDIYKSLNPLFLSLSNPDGAAELRRMRENLSETITEFVNENGSTALEDFDKSKFDNLEEHKKVESRSILSNVNISPSLITKWFDDKNIFNFTSFSSDDNDSESE